MAETPCPDETRHARHPSSYIGHSNWADQMLLTHDQRACKGCGGWKIWEPIDPEKLSAPAIVDGACSKCHTYYAEGALIRADGNGGWIALSCCQATGSSPRGRPGAAMSETRHRIADAATVLALRDQARPIREALQAATEPGDTVVLDFTGVEVITNAFADELVAGLAADRHLVLRGANAPVREALETVLARRGFQPAPTTEGPEMATGDIQTRPCSFEGCDRLAAYAITFRGQPGHVHECVACTAELREWADVGSVVPLPCPHPHGDGTTWVDIPRPLETGGGDG